MEREEIEVRDRRLDNMLIANLSEILVQVGHGWGIGKEDPEALDDILAGIEKDLSDLYSGTHVHVGHASVVDLAVHLKMYGHDPVAEEDEETFEEVFERRRERVREQFLELYEDAAANLS